MVRPTMRKPVQAVGSRLLLQTTGLGTGRGMRRHCVVREVGNGMVRRTALPGVKCMTALTRLLALLFTSAGAGSRSILAVRR